MHALARGLRLAPAATLLATLLATAAIGPAVAATCPSGFANGPYGTSVPYCADAATAPADGASSITLYFIAPSPFVDVLTIAVSAGQFVGGTGVFSTQGFPTTQVQLNGVNQDSQLRWASSTAGSATVTVSYVQFGTTHVESITPFTFTAVAHTPSTKSDCQAGGWRDHTDAQGIPFRNQGACVVWVVGA